MPTLLTVMREILSRRSVEGEFPSAPDVQYFSFDERNAASFASLLFEIAYEARHETSSIRYRHGTTLRNSRNGRGSVVTSD